MYKFAPIYRILNTARRVPMRIDKFISDCGLASRKEASIAAKRGQVLINGVAIRDTSSHINPEVDTVTFMGEEIEYHRFTYVMLNKPCGYVSATEDSRLPVVTELLPERLQKIELFPVGRLDRDTIGLMLLTNNGPLAHTLLSPRRHVAKEYYFESAEPLPSGAEDKFESGITLADGYECKSAKISLNPDRKSGVITLTEGKYHQIKRMIASFDNRVTHLKRIKFAEIPLDRTLEAGEWRYLSKEEIEILEQHAK